MTKKNATKEAARARQESRGGTYQADVRELGGAEGERAPSVVKHVRPNETLHRLRDWESGSALSEQLAAQILIAEGFADVDPSQPRGGPDGGIDAVCTRNGKRWGMAAYFPHGKLPYRNVRAKLLKDAKGAASKGLVDGIVFVTNQAFPVNQRRKLSAEIAPLELDIFHLDRIATILDTPKMHGVRRQFLGVDFPPPALAPQPMPLPRTSPPAEAAPPLFPTLGVFQPTVGSQSDLIAEQFFRLRIYSPAFERASFEPKEEDAFLARVQEVFVEDAGAVLEAPDAGRVLVGHAGLGRAFHRRWAWWTKAVVGMTATLTDLNRPGHYSVADVAVDVMRFITLASDVGGGVRGATADLFLELDPHPLEPEFDLSDKRARAHFPVTARLGGVSAVAHRTPTSTRGRAVAATYPIDSLKSEAVDFTAKALVLLMRSFHGARIDTEQFAASIPNVMAAAVRARTV